MEGGLIKVRVDREEPDSHLPVIGDHIYDDHGECLGKAVKVAEAVEDPCGLHKDEVDCPHYQENGPCPKCWTAVTFWVDPASSQVVK